MNRAKEKDCSILLKLIIKNGQYAISEVKYPEDIDIYSISDTQFLNGVNEIRNQNYSYLTFVNEENITQQVTTLFKILKEAINSLSILIYRKSKILKPLKRLSFFKPPFQSDGIDQIELNYQTNIESIVQQFEQQNLNQISEDEYVSENSIELDQIVKTQYEEIILNAHSQDFQMIFLNPFSINFNKMNNIYLDQIYFTLYIAIDCNRESTKIDSNIEDLKQYKMNNPFVRIDIFKANIYVKTKVQHDCKSSTCDSCEYYTRSYFTTINRIKIFNYDTALSFPVFLWIDFDKSNFRIYSEEKDILFHNQQNILNNQQSNTISFGYNSRFKRKVEIQQIPNMLSDDYLFVDKDFKDIFIDFDRALAQIFIIQKIDLQSLFNFSLKRLFIDLMYE